VADQVIVERDRDDAPAERGSNMGMIVGIVAVVLLVLLALFVLPGIFTGSNNAGTGTTTTTPAPTTGTGQ